jgi:hypothetical protein
MFLRSKVAAVVAGLYFLTFLGASANAYFDGGRFSGLPAVFLTWPFIELFPLTVPDIVAVPTSAVLNAVLIYILIAAFSKLLFFVPIGLLQHDAGDDGFGLLWVLLSVLSGVVGLVLSAKWVRKHYEEESRSD